MIEVKRGLLQDDAHPTLVTYADHSKLSAMMGAVAEKKGPGEVAGTVTGQKRRAEQDSTTVAAFASSLASGLSSSASEPAKEPAKKSRKHAASDVDLEIESLLNQQSTKEQQSKKVGVTGKYSHNMLLVTASFDGDLPLGQGTVFRIEGGLQWFSTGDDSLLPNSQGIW